MILADAEGERREELREGFTRAVRGFEAGVFDLLGLPAAGDSASRAEMAWSSLLRWAFSSVSMRVMSKVAVSLFAADYEESEQVCCMVLVFVPFSEQASRAG
jgi:hypothetical protein